VTLAVILALTGLALSAVLLQHHVAIEVGGDMIFNAVCDATENTNCDEVLQSQWGTIANVPTAMWGVVYFAAMGAWFLTIGKPRGTRRRWHWIVILAATTGAAGSAYLDYVMLATLKSWCPFCLATHVTSGLLFLVTLPTWPRRPKPIAADATAAEQEAAILAGTTYPPVRLVLVAMLLAAAVSGMAWNVYRQQIEKSYANGYRQKWEKMDAELVIAAKQMGHTESEYQDVYGQWQVYEQAYRNAYEKFLEQDAIDIPIMPGDPVRGRVDAPHTVVIFTDFLCPFCRKVEHMLNERLQQYPGQFRIVFKHYPMNKTCNNHVKNTLHSASCAAAVTAEAARVVGGDDAFWQMHDEIFADPDGFSRSSQTFVKEACERMGIDHDLLWEEIRTRGIWERIRASASLGNAIGVKSTPTLFFDGRRLAAWGDQHTWRFLLGAGMTPTTASATQPVTP